MLSTNKAFTWLTLVALAVGLALAGCGGGGSSSGGTEDASASSNKAADQKGKDPEGKGKAADEKEAAKKTKLKKEKPTIFKAADGEAIRSFGSPASSAETAAASAVLTGSLKAREAGQWAVQCALMTVATQEEVGELAKAKTPTPCAESLGKIAKPLASTEKIRADTLEGPISGLRMKGTIGYAYWNDSEGTEYAVPMKLEEGQWRVDSLQTTAIG
jgi:hypothetical protein